MKFINTNTNNTKPEAWEEMQSETDIETPQKSPFPSYAETIKKAKQKRK